jgi:hypothetical protein
VISAIRELVERESAEPELVSHEIRTLIDELTLITTPVLTDQAVSAITSIFFINFDNCIPRLSLTSAPPSASNYHAKPQDVNEFSVPSFTRPASNNTETILTCDLDNTINEILIKCSNNTPDSIYTSSNLTVLQHFSYDKKGILSSRSPPHLIFSTKPCQAWPGERHSIEALKNH